MVAVQSSVPPMMAFTPVYSQFDASLPSYTVTGSHVPSPFPPAYAGMETGSFVPLPTYTVTGSHVPLPFAPLKPMSKEEVEKAQAAAQERVQQEVDAQMSFATQAAEQSEKAVCAQIVAKREAKLVALEQSYVEEKMQLDQQHLQKLAGIEQEALAQRAVAVQATVQPGVPALKSEAIADQKAVKLELAQAQCEAAYAQLHAHHENQLDQVSLKAERKLALATSQIHADRDVSLVALEQRKEQDRLMQMPLAERQAVVAERVAQEAARALAHVTEQIGTEKSVATQAAELSEKAACAQIAAKRDAKLVALEQSFVEEKQKLEQDLANQVCGIEQEAAQVAAQVAGWVTVDSEAIAEQKARKLEVAQAQFAAALAQLTPQHEGQKEQVALKAERKLAVATSQIHAERDDRVAQLDERLEQEHLAVGQQRLQEEASLDATTLSVSGPKAAQQLQSRSEAFVAQQVEAEKSLAKAAAQRSEQRLAAQITQQREVELMRAEQSYLQEKMALEQTRAQAVANVERTAFLQLEQARAVQWVPGAQLPAMADTQFMARQVEGQFADALTRLTAQFEAQKAALVQSAERQEEAVRMQAKAEQQHRVAAIQQQAQRSVPAQFGYSPYGAFAPMMMPGAMYTVQTRSRGESHITDVTNH